MGYISDVRKFVGHAPIMCTGVGAIIYNKEGKILLQKRSDSGQWGNPGGAMELGETVLETLKREIKEETSLEIENPEFFAIYSGENEHAIYPNGDEVYYTNVIYKVEDYTGDLQKDEESEELRFFSLDEVPDDITPTLKSIVKDLKKKIRCQ